MSARRAATLLLIVAAALGATGCSQVSALAPVGGDALAEVRFGAIDVLLDHDIELLRAPVCEVEGAGPAVRCAGTTTAGEQIDVTSSTADGAILTITVDGAEIFQGPLQDVIDEAARG